MEDYEFSEIRKFTVIAVSSLIIGMTIGSVISFFLGAT